MNSPSELPDSAVGGWAPELPLTVPAPLMWPPRPLKVLRYLFGFPGLYFPWMTLYAGIALGIWELLQLSGSDLTHLSAGWIALLFGCNLVITATFYGAWHYQLYGRRAQGMNLSTARISRGPKRSVSVWPTHAEQRILDLGFEGFRSGRHTSPSRFGRRRLASHR